MDKVRKDNLAGRDFDAFNDNIKPYSNSLKIKSIYEFSNFDTLVDSGSRVFFEIIYNEEKMNEEFGMKNIFANDNLIEFRYDHVEVIKRYRKMGLCSILLLNSILTMIKRYEDRNFKMSLRNTVNTEKIEIEDKYRIYSRILTQKGENDMQYRDFLIGNRKQDIKELEELLSEKVSLFNLEYQKRF